MEPIKDINDTVIDIEADLDLTESHIKPNDKVYDISINGVPIHVDACTLFFANKRAKKYISKMKTASQEKTGSYRSFWADMIMLNVLTTRLLVKANPYMLEQLMNPLKHFTPEQAKAYYSKEQAKVEAQRREEMSENNNPKE